jgi:hypothetical protein
MRRRGFAERGLKIFAQVFVRRHCPSTPPLPGNLRQHSVARNVTNVSEDPASAGQVDASALQLEGLIESECRKYMGMHK